MQIQSWEGAALSRAETVLQGTTHDTVRAEIGYGEKVSQRLWSKKVEEAIGLTARQRDAERLEVPTVFELERVVSCRRADPWWRTKLNFGRRVPAPPTETKTGPAGRVKLYRASRHLYMTL
jgi:hypothetical protein